jgi:hypothetical protein
MPDKQIVIKLNDEQFETIMRLALEAGYTSLDEFAKDRLKATVDWKSASISTNSQPAQASNQPDESSLSMAASELKRIHQELQVFIREAVSGSERFGPFSEPESASTASKVDEWEEMAEQVFSNSPRLGSRAGSAVSASEKKPFPKESIGQQDKQTEPKRFVLPEDQVERPETPIPGGFSDSGGGPPPRKRSK